MAPRNVFFQRVVKNLLVAFLIMAICLAIGTTGYYYTCDSVELLDAFHNAAMILSGMGPVISISCTVGKWFSSFYALFSGVVFITNIGIILVPLAHRIFHKLHVEET